MSTTTTHNKQFWSTDFWWKLFVSFSSWVVEFTVSRGEGWPNLIITLKIHFQIATTYLYNRHCMPKVGEGAPNVLLVNQ